MKFKSIFYLARQIIKLKKQQKEYTMALNKNVFQLAAKKFNDFKSRNFTDFQKDVSLDNDEAPLNSKDIWGWCINDAKKELLDTTDNS